MIAAKLHWTEAYTIICDHTNCPGFETWEGRARRDHNNNNSNKKIYERICSCFKLRCFYKLRKALFLPRKHPAFPKGFPPSTPCPDTSGWVSGHSFSCTEKHI